MSPATARTARPASWVRMLPWAVILVAVAAVCLAWTPAESFTYGAFVGTDPSQDPIQRADHWVQELLVDTFLAIAVALVVLVRRTPQVGVPRPVGRRRVLDMVAVGAALVALDQVLVHVEAIMYRPDNAAELAAWMKAGAVVTCLALLFDVGFCEVAYRLTRTVSHPQRHHARVLAMAFVLPLLAVAEYGLQVWGYSRLATAGAPGLPWYVELPHVVELAVVAAVLVAVSWGCVTLARRDQR